PPLCSPAISLGSLLLDLRVAAAAPPSGLIGDRLVRMSSSSPAPSTRTRALAERADDTPGRGARSLPLSLSSPLPLSLCSRLRSLHLPLSFSSSPAFALFCSPPRRVDAGSNELRFEDHGRQPRDLRRQVWHA